MPSYMEICWVESLAIILTVNGAGKSSPALFPTKVLRIPQYLTENTLLRVEEGLLSGNPHDWNQSTYATHILEAQRNVDHCWELPQQGA